MKYIFALIIVILSSQVFALVNDVRKYIFDYKNSVYTFSYSSGFLGDEIFETSIFYDRFGFNFSYRQLGEFLIVNDQKSVDASFYINGWDFEACYLNEITKNFRYYISIFSEYEYYYYFSELYVGGSLGIIFDNSLIRLFNKVEIRSFVIELDGIISCRYGFTDVGIGYKLNYVCQDLFFFIFTRVFEHSGFSLSITSGLYYGTLKSINPFFDVSAMYQVVNIGYGVSFRDGLGIFQSLFLELKI
ncbi:MAG: hypothetical protein N2712_02420 [Brevinematales bacterium]|nr:hypothetical protein [Brevinematales bacterium]